MPLAPPPSPDASLAPPTQQGRPTGGDRRCKICDTVNAPNLRYCTSCGSTLDPVVVPTATATGGEGAPAVARPNAPAAIAPAQVVNLGRGAEGGTRTCARCRGTADSSAQFCKFCGASLGEPSTNGIIEGIEEPPPPPKNLPRGPTAPIAQVSIQAMHAMQGRASSPAPSPSPIAPAYPPAPSGASALGGIPRASSAPPPPNPAPAASAARPSAAPQRGRLVVIAKSGADGPSYPFGDLLDIGRTDGNVIVGEDPYLSPRHVRILWNSGKLLLRDLGSTNGVYLRLAPVRDTTPRRSSDSVEVVVPLADHDLILVGQQVLQFDVLKEAEGGFGPAQEHGTLLFGSPAAPRYARLCQRTVEGIARDVYYVRKVETVLGRESGDVVFTEDPFLSRRHAAIRILARDGSLAAGSAKPAVGEARFALVDLGSSNGTFLRIRTDVELAPGDHFRVGQQLFRVDFDGAR